MENTFNLKKFLAEGKLLKEEQEGDITSLVKSFYKTGMKMGDSSKAKEFVSNQLNRPLTPIEKGKITREFDKLYLADSLADSKKREEAEYAKKLERAQKNMLPLELDNWSHTPDPQYYNPAPNYYTTKGGGSVSEPNRDGTTTYKLKDEFKDKPITGTYKAKGKEYSIPDFYKTFYKGLL
jgi:hypothetical protein